MPMFRKKPVVVEAWPASEIWKAGAGDGGTWADMPAPVSRAYDRGEVLFLANPRCLRISTLEGWVQANLEDMVICGVSGELYPCKADIFAKTYEAA